MEYLIIGILLLVIAMLGFCAIWLLCQGEEFIPVALFIVGSIIFYIFFGVAAIDCAVNPQPKAMDVYQGKTEIEYQNFKKINGEYVPTDSVVVFKK